MKKEMIIMKGWRHNADDRRHLCIAKPYQFRETSPIVEVTY